MKAFYAAEQKRHDPKMFLSSGAQQPNPEQPERVDHATRVVRVQRPQQVARSVGDGGDHQLAVRQRLRTGDRHGGVHGASALRRAVRTAGGGGGIPVSAHRF